MRHHYQPGRSMSNAECATCGVTAADGQDTYCQGCGEVE